VIEGTTEINADMVRPMTEVRQEVYESLVESVIAAPGGAVIALKRGFAA